MSFYFVSCCVISIVCFGVIIGYFSGYTISAQLLSFGGSYWGLNINFNFSTLLILLMLLICFLYVCEYNEHYFNNDLAGLELGKIISLFVLVMASLVCTGDFLSTLIIWEYLGVVSYFLILFYGSYLSLRSSIVTLVSSRFGDVSLFILICLSCYMYNALVPALLLIFFIIFTKSAGFPFISWLLEAMRAPTPVSSLVHSSTLVAAGVWFALRYDIMLYFNNVFLLSICLLITIFITGLCCFFFIDLKKIVALSTCNNISWCVFYLIFGDWVLSLFQLISHGVSKCMLFMLVGDVMSGSGGSQSSNCVYSSSLYNNWGVFSLFSVILGLSGAPFIGVFFTKHLLLTFLMGVNNTPLFIFILCCIFLSYFYSFRLCSILINISSSLSIGVLYFFNSGLMVYFWLFVNYFLAGELEESNNVCYNTANNLLVFQVICCFIAYFFYNVNIFSRWSSSLFGCDNVVESVYMLLFNMLNIVSIFFYRWDNYVTALCNNLGVSSINVYTVNILNILFILITIFLTCFYIVY